MTGMNFVNILMKKYVSKMSIRQEKNVFCWYNKFGMNRFIISFWFFIFCYFYLDRQVFVGCTEGTVVGLWQSPDAVLVAAAPVVAEAYFC